MEGMAQQPARLPRETIDHGDRIEISPPTRKRLVNVALGLVVLAAGTWIAVIGPGGQPQPARGQPAGARRPRRPRHHHRSGEASLAGGEAIVGVLRDRGWLPQEVAVSVEGGE